MLANGLLNKQVAFELGITEYTVQLHRGHIMRKMEADSFATLVRMADKVRLHISNRQQMEIAAERDGTENAILPILAANRDG
jgi:DNA-binding NarL/FixJ family response regulator